MIFCLYDSSAVIMIILYHSVSNDGFNLIFFLVLYCIISLLLFSISNHVLLSFNVSILFVICISVYCCLSCNTRYSSQYIVISDPSFYYRDMWLTEWLASSSDLSVCFSDGKVVRGIIIQINCIRHSLTTPLFYFETFFLHCSRDLDVHLHSD